MYRRALGIKVIILIIILAGCYVKEEVPPNNSLELSYKTIRKDSVQKYAGYIFKDIFKDCLDNLYSSYSDSVTFKTFVYKSYVAGYAYYCTEYFNYPSIQVVNPYVIDEGDTLRPIINIPDLIQQNYLNLEEKDCRKVINYYHRLTSVVIDSLVNFHVHQDVYHAAGSQTNFLLGMGRGYEDAQDGTLLSYDQFNDPHLSEYIQLLFGSKEPVN